MQDTLEHSKPNALHTFVRNRYYYGKLLDVFQFELESDYLNHKRWLLNRLVSGYGVLCGLDVHVAPPDAGRALVVTPGVALDRAGHEIIVPRTSAPIALRSRPSSGCCESDVCVHLCICFQQCECDPAPVMVDACGEGTECAASAYQERYRFEVRDGKAPEIQTRNGLPDLILNGRINYSALVERVTHCCPALPADLCIPLATISLPPADDPPQPGDIDINPRPIVYSNDLLFDMFRALAGDTTPRIRGGKQ